MPNLRTKPKKVCRTLPFILLAHFALGAMIQEEEVLDEIVAKVNHEIVTLTDLKNELKVLRASLRSNHTTSEEVEKAFEQRKKGLLKNFIENKLLLQRAEDLGMGANIESDVEAHLEQVRDQNGIPSLQVFDQILKRQGSSLILYRESIRKSMIISLLVQRMVYAKIALLTPEIQAFYEENLDRFTLPAEVELAEILVLKKGDDTAQAQLKSEEILSRLQAGDSFEELAKQHSDGPTASRGGKIGTFRKGSMAQNLERAAFDLEPGAISGIVESDYGFQILALLDKKDARRKPLEEVRPEIQNELYQKKAQPELREFINRLREEGYIYVAPSYQEEFDVGDGVDSS